MQLKTLRTWTSVVVGGIALAGCQNLNLPDINQVTLQQSLASAGTIEETVGSATKYYMGVMEGLDARQGTSFVPSFYMSAVDEELTSASDFQSLFIYSGFEPRAQFSNQNAAPSWLNRIPSQDLGTAGAMCNNVLVTLKQGVIKIGAVSAAVPQGTHTDRDKWWCEFLVGSGNMYRGVMFDQGIPSPDTTPIISAAPTLATMEVAHDSLIDFGIGQTQLAIRMALAAPADTTSNTWVNGVSYNNTDAAKIMYSTLARVLPEAARNTEERATLPVANYTWNTVITWIDSGITAGGIYCNGCPNWSVDGQSQTFSQAGGFVNQGNGTIKGAFNYYIDAVMSTGATATNPRISPRFLGPWDTTGAWQWWLGGPGGTGSTTKGPSCPSASATAVCFLNDTGSFAGRTDTTFGSPDKRINAYAAGVPQKGSLKNTNNGLYFGRFRCDGTSTAAVSAATAGNGAWAESNYIFFRYPNGIAGVPTISGCAPTTSANAPFEFALYSDISPEEMNFLLGEALIRTGGNLQTVANIINATRVTVGGLPPVTTAGVPQSPGCVPRNEDQTCTNLMMTLLYEKRIEMIGESMLTNWTDWRGFGKMLWGSMFQMPPEARELFALGLPIYTYGGNSPGSAFVPCTGIIGSGIGCVSIYP